MQPVLLHLDDRRAVVAERADLVASAAAAFALAQAGSAGLPSAVAAGQLALAALLAAGIVREGWLASRGRDGGIGVVGVAAGAALLLEAYLGWSGGGKLVSPALLSGVAVIATGLFQPVIRRRMRARRVLRIDAEGVEVRMGRFRRYAARWAELRAVDATPAALRFTGADGRVRRIGLRVYRNRNEIAAAVAAAAIRKGLGGGAEAPAALTPAGAAPPTG